MDPARRPRRHRSPRPAAGESAADASGSPDLRPSSSASSRRRHALHRGDTVPAESSPDTRALILYDVSGKPGDGSAASRHADREPRGALRPLDGQAGRRLRARRARAVHGAVYVGSSYGERLPADASRRRPADEPARRLGQRQHPAARGAGAGLRRSLRMAASSARPLRRRRGALQGEIAHTLGPAGRDHAHARLDRSRSRVSRDAVRSDGSTFPWALRSQNLTYVGELPFVYTSETDRYLVFADLLFDALAPRTPERHRALLRLEDINPRTVRRPCADRELPAREGNPVRVRSQPLLP